LSPESSQCANGVVCPSNFVCHADGCASQEQLRACDGKADDEACSFSGVPNGTCFLGACEAAASELSVALVSPSDQDEDVSVSTDIVVAMTHEVDEVSLAERVTLTNTETGGAVELVLVASGGNSFLFRPATSLAGESLHRIDVLPGIEAIDTRVRDSRDVFESAFTTALPPDLTAPAVISELRVDHQADDRVVLSWLKPAEPEGESDFEGVLVVRTSGAEAVATPSNGTSYSTGEPLGNTEVLGNTQSSQWIDVTVTAGYYDYVLFAYDAERNYSAPVRAPFVSGFDAQWCTDETGTFQVHTTNADEQYLWLSSAPQTPAGLGLYHPTNGAPLGTQPFPGSSVVGIGETYYLRPVARGPGGTYLGVEQEFLASPAALATVNPPANPGLGGSARFDFETYDWTTFEGEIDTDTGPGHSWSSTATVDPVLGRVSATMDEVGDFAFRVRPVEAGCTAAPWTVSAEFSTGQNLYVATTGDDTLNDGLDSENPKQTLGAAIAIAAGNSGITEIHVAEGTYDTELVVVPHGVRLIGSYNGAFSTRSLDPPTSVIEPPSVSDYRTLTVNAGLEDSLIDGFEVVGGEAASGCTTTPNCAAILIEGTSGNVTLRNVHVRATSNMVSSFGIRVRQGASATIEDCDIDLAGTNIDNPAIRLNDDSRVVAVRNHVTSVGDGIDERDDSTLVAVANEIRADEQGIMSRGNDAVIANNLIDAAGDSALEVRSNAYIANNTFRGGGGSNRSVETYGSNGPSFVNNLILSLVDANGDAARVDYNVFSNVAYEDSASTYFNTICSGNLGTSGCGTVLTTPTGIGNRETGGFAAIFFASPTDWRLTSSTPTSVTLESIDLSTELCAASGLSECSIFDVDKDGVPRTCPTPVTDCWSAGAYEYDAP